MDFSLSVPECPLYHHCSFMMQLVHFPPPSSTDSSTDTFHHCPLFFSTYLLKLFVYRELANRAFARHHDDRRRVDVLGMPLVAYLVCEGARCWWRSWLRHCATSRKVAGSIPDVVIGIFHWHNPTGRTMALRLTQLPTEMSKGGRCLRLTTVPPSCADYLEIWEPKPAGTLRACLGL